MATDINEDSFTRAWQHKQELDRLPTFASKFEYLLANREIIEDYLYKRPFYNGENLSFMLYFKPETDNDKYKVNWLWMDSTRESFFKSKNSVSKSGKPLSEDDKEEVSFNIKPKQDLILSLESRLATTIRQKDLLTAELTKITEDINAVCSRINVYTSDLTYVIEELRYFMETKRDYDFTFANENSPLDKAFRVAMVWDIIHYEAYLKDKLASLASRSLATSKVREIIPTKLSARQRALLAILQDEPILRSGGDSHLYNRYLELYKKSDRTGYANESWRKAELLIRDYEAIIPLLTPERKKQAESEILIIRAGRT